MRALQTIGVALFIIGLASLSAGILNGEVSFFLVIIVPIFMLNGPWSVAGLVLMLLGFFVLIGAYFSAGLVDDDSVVGRDVGANRTIRTSSGGVILIGPIPIIWGESNVSKRMRFALLILGLAITLIVLAILFLR